MSMYVGSGLMPFNVSDLHDDDGDDIRKIYEFSPPLFVRLPWIISTLKCSLCACVCGIKTQESIAAVHLNDLLMMTIVIKVTRVSDIHE